MKLPIQWNYMAFTLLSLIILIMDIILMANQTLKPVWGSFVMIVAIGIILYLLYLGYQGYRIDSIQKLVLIGPSGVGKTLTYNYLQCTNISSYQGFTIGTSEELCVVDTPDFDLESTIEIREKRITQFQEFFIKNQNSIRAFLVVVNFERTDLMKAKILKTIKYLNKLNSNLFLLVTNFELSENQIEDEESLKKAFGFFHFEKILFHDKEINNTGLKQKLLQIMNTTPQKEINLKDTIFEKYGDTQDQQILQQITNQVNQKQNLKDNLLRI
ncbi:unnamed protein product (macronuclear) [Paramecium tetraurelia]|uniref:Signal recognition particle receptor subunit beta n=1 Tax=Paramecium tetraurelia TaxID=5888 RepID=A0BEQ1_PARTE|nr:uncharacterized protein GSPATT00028051001 [Paramecium tetraurelia]CAK57018.1 unnamed protein product [Paramecium tetraurelia]|eukprot:XP_001424416.1 hypothetical protein (macronuclear) [Paramecium tetraurelia strain d4-2]